MIKKIGSNYVVLSEMSGRRMGTYRTLAQAKKRLRQIEFFKHLVKSKKLQMGLRKRSLLK